MKTKFAILPLLPLLLLISACGGGDSDGEATPEKSHTTSTENSSVEGYWINPEGEALAEFVNGKLIVSFLDDDSEQFITDYEMIDSGRYQIKASGFIPSSMMTVDYETGQLNLNLLKSLAGDQGKMLFVRPQQVAWNDLKGKWYSVDSYDNWESSTIVTIRTDSFDWDSLDLDHEKKTFTRTLSKNGQLLLEHGFIFTDTDDSYTYYLLALKDNAITYVDSEGLVWSETRKEAPTHIKIPEGYTEKTRP